MRLPSARSRALAALAALAFAPQASAQLQWQKLVEDYGARFGAALAIDGDRLAVGAPLPGTEYPFGHVYLFRASASGWQLEQGLTNFFGPSVGGFGSAVALDCERLLVGAPYDDGVGEATGTAMLYRWTGPGGWVQEARFRADDGRFDERFGVAVAVSGDLALVGASHDEDQGFQAGAVFAYRRVHGQWTLEQKLLAPGGGARDLFGSALALQGTRALIGARGDSRTARHAGAAHVFEHGAGGWTAVQTLTAADADAQDLFGAAVALDGDLALVGALGDDELRFDAGAVYAFELAGTWVQRAKILSPDEGPYYPELFGSSLALDRPRALIGAPGGAGPGGTGAAGSGSAYAVARTPQGWEVPRELVLETSAVYLLGSAVALHGSAQAVSAPTVGCCSGWVYAEGGNASWPSSNCPAAPNSTGAPGELRAGGDRRIASNGLLLEARALPPGEPGYFLLSDGLVRLPGFGGGQGTRCVGPAVWRFSHDVVLADAGGYLAFRPDLTALPAGLQVQPGETWHFQLWYRDHNPGPTSNTSPAASVPFE